MKHVKKWGPALLKFIHIQLFITLISLPILAWWGLPFSLLSFAGNFIFGPILTLFLLLSSVVFFCEIINIPNQGLISALEYLSRFWLYIMGWSSPHSLWALSLPPFFLLLIPLTTLIALHYRRIHSAYHAIGCYSLILASAFAISYVVHRSHEQIEQISCNKGAVTLVMSDTQTAIIDPGIIGQRISGISWAEYTLLAHLAKEYGITTIDHFIVAQPNRIIFDVLESLLKKITIQHIYLPWWEGELPRYWWKRYNALKKQAEQKKCTLHRIYRGQKIVRVGNATITITPLDTILTRQTFSYHALCITTTLATQTNTLYSTRYRREPSDSCKETPII